MDAHNLDHLSNAPLVDRLKERVRTLELELEQAYAALGTPPQAWPADAVEVRVRAVVDSKVLAPVYCMLVAPSCVLEQEDLVALRARQLYRAITAK